MVSLSFMDDDESDNEGTTHLTALSKKLKNNKFKSRKINRENNDKKVDSKPIATSSRVKITYGDMDNDDDDDDEKEEAREDQMNPIKFKFKTERKDGSSRGKTGSKRHISSLLNDDDDMGENNDVKSNERNMESYLASYITDKESIIPIQSPAANENMEGIVIEGSDIEEDDKDAIMHDVSLNFENNTKKANGSPGSAHDPYLSPLPQTSNREPFHASFNPTRASEKLLEMNELQEILDEGETKTVEKITLSIPGGPFNIKSKETNLVFNISKEHATADGFENVVHKVKEKIASLSGVVDRRELELNHLQKERDRLVTLREEYAATILRSLPQKQKDIGESNLKFQLS